MRHDWVFDILQDLKSYAIRNDMPGLAASVDQAIAVALSEVEGRSDGPAPPTGQLGQDRSGPTH